jgi:hypothetical protein
MKHFFKYTTAICVIIIFFLTQCEGEKEIIEVPIKIEVPVPAIEGKFEPIKAPEPIIVEVPTIDKQKEFILMDSIGKLNAYIEAITVREYLNTFEDDTIKIDTWSKVRGELLAQSNDYFIKPRTIQLDTVIEIQKPAFNALFLYGGTKYHFGTQSVAFEAKLIFKNKRNNLLSIGVDSEGTVSGGYGFKL